MIKKLKIVAFFTTIASIIFYCSILLQPMYFFEFDALPILLFSAEALFGISIILIISVVYLTKHRTKIDLFKKIISILCVFIIVCTVALVGYNNIIYYDGYTPQNYAIKNKEHIQKLFPYHEFNQLENFKTDISASYVTGTKYLWLDSHGISTYGMYQDYDVRYFESLSLFMNFKFRLETENPFVKNWAELEVVAQGEKIEVDGKTVVFFNSNGDYGVLVKDFNKATYATLTSAEYAGVSIEEFARVVLSQHEELKAISKSNVFFDIPFSDKFNRRVLEHEQERLWEETIKERIRNYQETAV